jgi:hypothetical protein
MYRRNLNLQKQQTEQEEKRTAKNKLLDPVKDAINNAYLAERVGCLGVSRR